MKDDKSQGKDTKETVKPIIDEVIDDYRSPGITSITERRVVTGPDGKRRVLSRRKIVNTPPEQREQI